MRISMFIYQRLLDNIPWENYSEEEVQKFIELMFRTRGFEVYNAHEIDRRGEGGGDLIITRKGEVEKLYVAVKRKPGKSDINQLKELAKQNGQRIYIYASEPSLDFKKRDGKNRWKK